MGLYRADGVSGVYGTYGYGVYGVHRVCGIYGADRCLRASAGPLGLSPYKPNLQTFDLVDPVTILQHYIIITL